MRMPYERRKGVGENCLEHRLIAERVLGKPLPKGAMVHHANGDKSDNRNSNLVICQDMEYHKLLHTRMLALKEYGDVHARRCVRCKKWDLVGSNGLVLYPMRGRNSLMPCHKLCNAKHVLRMRKQKEGVLENA